MSSREMPTGDEAARRAYGLLATNLNEALHDARQALEPHAELLPNGRIGDIDTLLEEFAARRVRIALYGEVKAGKSTMLNALAGAELSPVAFDPLTSIPVRITHGHRTVWQVGTHRLDNLAELTQLMRTGIQDAGEVVIETDVELLRLGGQVDLLDTPGVGSDERFDAISAEALKALDAVVLVVRYPALYTQVTRRLVEALQADIGKLFVVWNLDADCAEITAEERQHEAERLRAAVDGAHELYLVDARAAFRARQAGDAAALAASGLASFTEALARFASSDKREVTALREAAKRALRWLDEAVPPLTQRRTELDVKVRETRERIQKVQTDAEARTSAARKQFAEYQAAAGAAAQKRAQATAKAAEALRKSLRAARRGWVQDGALVPLEKSVAAAAGAYADAVLAANRAAGAGVRDAAKQFGTQLRTQQPERTDVRPATLAPPDRIARIQGGNARLLRRAIWRRWYLPGVAALEREGVESDLAAQTAWFEKVARTAEPTVRGVLDARVAEIARTAQAEMERIRVETNFLAEEAELDALTAHIPAVTGERTRIEETGREARALLG